MKASLDKDRTNQTEVFFQHDISVNGHSYIVIFGKYINGGFICIPNWSIGCEASAYTNSAPYNAEKMISAGLDPEVATTLAEYIDAWILQNQ